ncbi:alanine racemase, partial [Mycobacteroides abscessus subsp. abscessus]
MGPVSTTSTTTDGLPPSTGATTAQAVIDLGAIAHNVKLLREHAGTARLMTVVKADGYGHGAVRVARAALAAGADELGVTSIAEALQIRAAGLDAPLLAWLHAPGA